jgi:predicted nucleic acid-binding protein
LSVVVDASFAVAWFAPERPAGPQNRLLETTLPMLAPDLMVAETANALCRKERKGEILPGQVPGMLVRLRGLDIVLWPFGGLLDAAIALALTLRHTVPDCMYLALARREQAMLATFDLRLAALATSLAIPLWSPLPSLEAP